MGEMSGAEALVRCLENEGVEFVFGTSGHTNLALLDAFNDSEIRFIAVPHEQMATHAADCYYRVSGRPGVVLTTLGPGLGNTVTGLLDAAQDCSAVLLITGNVPSSQEGREAFQELAMHGDANQVDILRPAVKRAWHVSRVGDVTFAMARALNVALTGRPGPVVVDVAMDVFTAVEDIEIPEMGSRRPHGRPRADADATRQALTLLAEASSPLIVAGGGAVLSDAQEPLRGLAEHFAIPVITSMIGQGALPNDHLLYGGFTGAVGTPTAHELARHADVALAVGTKFSELDCNSWSEEAYLPIQDSCRLIHIDIEPTEIGRIYPTEIGLVGDAYAVLDEMVTIARESSRAADLAGHPRVSALVRARAEWQAQKESLYAIEDELPLEAAAVVNALRQVMPPDGVLVTGVGIRHLVGQHFTLTNPRTHIVASGNGTMGLSVPGVLGVSLALPDRVAVSLTGDGEFRSLASTLAVAVEHDIPAVWVVINNGGMHSISLYQNRHYGRTNGTLFVDEKTGEPRPVDYVALAAAFGVDALRIERGTDLVQVLRHAVDARRPFLVDVPVTDHPRIFASGSWVANTFLKTGWNAVATP